MKPAAEGVGGRQAFSWGNPGLLRFIAATCWALAAGMGRLLRRELSHPGLFEGPVCSSSAKQGALNGSTLSAVEHYTSLCKVVLGDVDSRILFSNSEAEKTK